MHFALNMPEYTELSEYIVVYSYISMSNLREPSASVNVSHDGIKRRDNSFRLCSRVRLSPYSYCLTFNSLFIIITW